MNNTSCNDHIDPPIFIQAWDGHWELTVQHPAWESNPGRGNEHTASCRWTTIRPLAVNCAHK